MRSRATTADNSRRRLYGLSGIRTVTKSWRWAEHTSSVPGVSGTVRDLRRYTSVKYRDIIRTIERHGWHLVSQEGSHRQYKHPVKLGKVTIAGKPGLDVPPKTLNSILRQAGLKI